MAERRMFSKSIIDRDNFLEMPLSAQALYFHLSMRADDEGFIGNSRSIIKLIGANEDDFKLLVLKQFLILFDSGVIVIRHWKLHNYLRNDRFKPTLFVDEKAKIEINATKVYEFKNFNTPEKENFEARKLKNPEDNELENVEYEVFGEHNNVLLKRDECKELKALFGTRFDKKVNRLSQYIFQHPDWSSYSHYRTLIIWDKEDRERNKDKYKPALSSPPSYDLEAYQKRSMFDDYEEQNIG